MKKGKQFRILTFLMIGFLFSSFLIRDRDTNEFCETWVYSKYEDGCTTFVKSRSFKLNKPGISFDPNGTLKKRQNVGWCGTRPITYGNFSGTWKQLSKEKIALEYAYWGGTMSEEWIIVELTKNSLKVKTIETEND